MLSVTKIPFFWQYSISEASVWQFVRAVPGNVPFCLLLQIYPLSLISPRLRIAKTKNMSPESEMAGFWLDITTRKAKFHAEKTKDRFECENDTHISNVDLR